MKTFRQTVFAGVLCAVAAAVCCTVTAAAAPVDDAYRAYNDFLQDQIDSIGLPADDVPEDELTKYTVRSTGSTSKSTMRS